MRLRSRSANRYSSRARPGRYWATGALSLVLHGLGMYGLSLQKFEIPPKPEEPKVLQISLIRKGVESDKPAEDAPLEPEEQTEPTPTPTPAPQPVPAPKAVQPVAPPQPVVPVGPAPSVLAPRPAPTSFADFRQRRISSFVNGRIPDPGGVRDGDLSSNQGRDKCTPAPGRKLDRLYLLYDSSGSMSGQLKSQALRCAQQYAQEAIAAGATVVVGNFARHASFIPPTRNMTDIAFALRDDNDFRATVLPSTELYQFFDTEPDVQSDLVILSDGYIPNYRETLASYRYFLDLNQDNRAYLYTLGTPGHPDVTAALTKLGFEIYIYRVI